MVKENNKNRTIFAVLSIVILVMILLIIFMVNKTRETSIEKFNNTVLASIESIRKVDIKKEYVLVEFPDTKGIITKNGKIARNNNNKYDEFKKGYIIYYKDKTYAFKLSDGVYCAYKGFADTGVEVDISAECEDYEIEYK